MNYKTILVRVEHPVCYIKLNRQQVNNAINTLLIDECLHALAVNHHQVHLIVLEGLPHVFCSGADFKDLSTDHDGTLPESLYTLWEQLSGNYFISIAHIRGRVNAGGIGLASACDLVLADQNAEFSLPELLFSLFPACVLPFLIRRIGFQRAHYMTLTTKPITASQALDWGLVDAIAMDSDALLRQHLIRLRRLSKSSVEHYKTYINELDISLKKAKSAAISANRAMFSNNDILKNIDRYTRTGRFPWEN